ncbi:MAG: sugar-binding domain-containing protein, partial [Planctomycetota bacterium]
DTPTTLSRESIPAPSESTFCLRPALVCVCVADSALSQWRPVEGKMLTRWGRELTPEKVWSEYPRPGLVRASWTNLNGTWDYAVTSSSDDAPERFDGKILVPFAIESPLSGVGKLLEPDQVLWYRRSFKTEEHTGRTLLHFEAVDYECAVFVNGIPVGKHVGSSDPFTFDITEQLKPGENELLVRVIDKTAVNQTRGKQKLQPKGIYYTRVSGIWQTVWLETVPQRRIKSIKMKPRIADGTLRVLPTLAGPPVKGERIEIVVSDTEGNRFVADSSLMAHLGTPHLWTPEDPYLYNIELQLFDAEGKLLDRVTSYAGMREFSVARDDTGHLRLRLNGEFVFHYGTLDQGWWPDGLLTPPSDEAMRFDIEYLKRAGFNTIRKHIKIEPRRYYYHCDRLGMLVWQDMPSTGGGPEWTRLAPGPPEQSKSPEEKAQFVRELKSMVLTLQNHPCIAMWVLFNERWGQHETVRHAALLENLDVRRSINVASGGNFFPAGDVADHHAYPNPEFPDDPKRFRDYVKVVGEFGGHGWRAEGHLWNPEMKNWGYGGLPKTLNEYKDRYRSTFEKLMRLKSSGIAAGIYTQTSDVEGEVNGLLTYDREVEKIPREELAELHEKVRQANDQ